MEMEKRIFILILVVVVGVMVGVSIVSKQAKDPFLREVLEQQTSMLRTQKQIVKMIKNEYDGDGDNNDGSGSKIKQLEARVASLEAQLKGIQDIFKQVKAQGGNTAPTPQPSEPSPTYDIALDHSPVRGSSDASVTIVEFVDFQCPYCARFHPLSLQALKMYPEKVNYVLKNFPLSFHPNAKPAAKAAFAAGEQGKYWEMTDLLLAGGNILTEEKFVELAGNLGLNVEQFKDDYKNKDAQWEEYIAKDMALGQKVNVRGTPAFYINGRPFRGRDFNDFKGGIDRALSEIK